MYLPLLLTFLTRLSLTISNSNKTTTIYFKCQANACEATDSLFVGLILLNPNSNWQDFPIWTVSFFFFFFFLFYFFFKLHILSMWQSSVERVAFTRRAVCFLKRLSSIINNMWKDQNAISFYYSYYCNSVHKWHPLRRHHLQHNIDLMYHFICLPCPQIKDLN